MLFEHDDPVKVLSEEECWQLLGRTQHGRLVTVVGHEIDIVPINYRAVDGRILVRTAPGTKLAGLTISSGVAFETDAVLSGEAWSVVVKGTARVLETQDEIMLAEAAGIESWIPVPKEFYVEIRPSQIDGRHFRLGKEPEEYPPGLID